MSEQNDVERENPRPVAPCRVYAGDEVALRLRFAWHSDSIDPLQVAKSTRSVSNLSMPERVNLPQATVIGYDGAISTTSCKTEAGSPFTLSVLSEGANPTRDTYRAPLEEFMHACFPAAEPPGRSAVRVRGDPVRSTGVFDLRHLRGNLFRPIGQPRSPYGRLSELLGRVLMLRASRREDRKRVPQYSSFLIRDGRTGIFREA